MTSRRDLFRCASLIAAGLLSFVRRKPKARAWPAVIGWLVASTDAAGFIDVAHGLTLPPRVGHTIHYVLDPHGYDLSAIVAVVSSVAVPRPGIWRVGLTGYKVNLTSEAGRKYLSSLFVLRDVVVFKPSAAV